MKQRDIVVALVLSFLTCGIYGIYWFICMTDEANALAEEPDTSGGMAFLLTLVTCGIYAFYWFYKMGKKVYMIQLKHNDPSASDDSILYIILAFVGLGIVNYALIQSKLNKCLEA